MLGKLEEDSPLWDEVESLDNDELIKKLHEDRLPINNIDEAIKENNLLFFIVKKFYKTNFKM